MHNPAPVARGSHYFDYPVYPFEAPPELKGQGQRHAVAIVGGGPVGLTLALELAKHGARAVVLEDDQTVADGSRAVCISRRSMEILRGLDLDRVFLAKALGWTGGRSFYRGEVVFELEMPHRPNDRFHPMTNLQQCYMERFLVAAAAAEPNIEIRWQSRVVGLDQAADGVRLSVDTPQGPYTLACDYAVACDGARSEMRRLMGLRLSGTSYEGRYLIADIKMPTDHPIERRAWFDPPSNPGSTVLMHKQPDDIWRVDYQLLDDADIEAELSEARIRERIQTHLDSIGETTPWELDWYSLYQAHCLCLDDYRQGRVLFAGDAAHLVPIFGVRGLNSGFADANNLGWKLAAVLAGEAGPNLIDSYNQERRGATQEIFREAEKSTIFMTPPTRGYRILRDAVLNLSLSEDFARGLIDPRQSAPYDYVDSVLNAPNALGASDADFAGGPRIGASARDVRLADGGFLSDRWVPGFMLLVFADRALAVEGAEVLPIGGTDGLPDPDGRIAAAYDARPGSVYLLRPDGHVAARWRSATAARIAAALRTARGGLSGGLSEAPT